MSKTQLADEGPGFFKSIMWAFATLALFTLCLGALWQKSEESHPQPVQQVANR